MLCLGGLGLSCVLRPCARVHCAHWHNFTMLWLKCGGWGREGCARSGLRGCSWALGDSIFFQPFCSCAGHPPRLRTAPVGLAYCLRFHLCGYRLGEGRWYSVPSQGCLLRSFRWVISFQLPRFQYLHCLNTPRPAMFIRKFSPICNGVRGELGSGPHVLVVSVAVFPPLCCRLTDG